MTPTPATSAATAALLRPSQRIGDLDVFFADDGLRIVREPAPWQKVLATALSIGGAAGGTIGILTGQEHGRSWGLAGFLIGFSAGVLGVVLVMRRGVLVEVRDDVLLWQDTGRFFGRNLHSIALDDIAVIRVGPRPSLLLEERNGRSTGLLPGMMPAQLQQVGVLLEGYLDRRRR